MEILSLNGILQLVILMCKISTNRPSLTRYHACNLLTSQDYLVYRLYPLGAFLGVGLNEDLRSSGNGICLPFCNWQMAARFLWRCVKIPLWSLKAFSKLWYWGRGVGGRHTENVKFCIWLFSLWTEWYVFWQNHLLNRMMYLAGFPSVLLGRRFNIIDQAAQGTATWGQGCKRHTWRGFSSACSLLFVINERKEDGTKVLWVLSHSLPYAL